MKTEQPIVDLCDTFGVSRSGYYDWRQRQHASGPRAREEEQLRERVSAVHERSRKTYGSPRIQNSAPKGSTKSSAGFVVERAPNQTELSP